MKLFLLRMKLTIVFLIVFILLISNFYSFSQSVDDIKSQNYKYLWGEGKGVTIKQADKEALSMLISQIHTQVKSSYEQQWTEVNGKLDEKVKSILQTYSNATLSNTERIVVSNEPEAIIIRYIKRDELAKIFESRKNKILEFTKSAQYSIEKLQIADALRYYYWAYVLLRSHPDFNNIKYSNSNDKFELLSVYLPRVINDILNNIHIKIINAKQNDGIYTYTLAVKYNNQAVSNFTYCFWDGVNYSYFISAKDGIGIVEHSSRDMLKEIKIKAEYAFEGESTIDFELHDAMIAIEDEISFNKAFFNVFLDTIPSNVSSVNQTAVIEKDPVLKELKNSDDYLLIMKKLEIAINTKNYKSVESYFTEEGYLIFKKLIAYGQAKIILTPEYKFMEYGKQVLCRSMKMSFYFPNNNRKFVEDVVYTFNTDKKIENLSFGLNQNTLNDILTPDKPWSDELKVIIVNFLENYKTAYALKRIDYIEKIFSDDAIIITGSIAKIKNTGEVKYKDNNIVRYNTQTKEQYLKNLRFCFNSNEYINLRFNESNIRKSARGEEVYGIQLKQDYFSSNYGDTGYLFLLVDLKNADEPIIHVRTWQPEKNDNGSIYGIEDF